LIYRSNEPLSFSALTFAGPDGTDDRIETLAGFKQLVVEGEHQATGRPYEWRRPIVSRDQLTLVTKDQVEAFYEGQRGKLPRAIRASSGATVDRSKVNQAGLLGDPDLLRKALRAIPNSAAAFPTYDDWIRMGQAIMPPSRTRKTLAKPGTNGLAVGKATTTTMRSPTPVSTRSGRHTRSARAGSTEG
jgi:hypothetical protein